jgi:hypothetical protein
MELLNRNGLTMYNSIYYFRIIFLTSKINIISRSKTDCQQQIHTIDNSLQDG